MIPSRASELPTDVRHEYPFAGNTVRLDSGVSMHYIDEGQGPVVVMLHGNPTWSFYYRNLIKYLSSRGFRCIVPDHVGCGLSDKPAGYNYTLAQRIDDVEFLMQRLALEDYRLVVHDWGGAIGCGVAGRRPEALQKVVILNTGAFRTKRIPLRIAAVKVPFLGEGIIRGLNGFAGPAIHMSVKVPLRKVVKRGLLWPYNNWKNRVAVWNFVKDIPLISSHQSYATLTEVEAGLAALTEKPVAIEWGAHDFCFNDHFLKRWQNIFPQAEVKVHENAGHYVLEDATDSVCSRVYEFLAS